MLIGTRDVVLVAGAAAGTWLNPITGAVGTLRNFADALADPQDMIVSRLVSAGVIGNLTVVGDGNGFTVTSSSGTDTSTVRVTGIRYHSIPVGS